MVEQQAASARRPSVITDEGVVAVTPGRYAARLLHTLGRETVALPIHDERGAAALWAASGAMWLTGHPEGHGQRCAAPLAAAAQGAWLALSALAPDKLDPAFDAYRLLGERAAIAGLTRRGRTSVGGSCHLLRARDGQFALNLARDSDLELLPAWLEAPVTDREAMIDMVAERPVRELVERARLLGLAAARAIRPRGESRSWFRAHRVASPVPPLGRPPLVMDLGALWAAPLCAQILRQAGARVVKVESISRVDGARSGPTPFFDLLNGGKESVALDLAITSGRLALMQLLAAADIVVESSRPRALEQMGICIETVLKSRPGKVWLSITGYGRRAPMRDWIGFGDDAGVAAGLSRLVGDRESDLVFCGDAIADPLTGLHAALLALNEWQLGGGRLLDVSLAGVVRFAISGRGKSARSGAAVFEPREPIAREPKIRAAALGVDTTRVLREFAARSH
ncbi:MAG: CoA transferase [Dehalococcoidia bacterium]